MSAAGFVVSSLPAYVENNRDILLKNFGLVGTATRRRIAIQTGIKKSAYLNYLDVAPTLQSGVACGYESAGSVTLTQRTITVADIKVNLDICAKNLIGKWAEYLVRVNANERDLPFEQFIMDGIVAELNKKIEKLIWQGDHTQSSDADIKWIDGLIYQFDNDSDVIDVSIANGTAAYNAIKAVYMALPEEVLERNAEIYVSPALYREFLQALVEKNFFHYAGPAEAAPEEFFFPGTDCRVVKTPGLAGVSNKIVGTFPDNLVYGTDMENDWEDILVAYEAKTKTYSLVAEWASGIAYKFPNMVVLGTIADS